MLINRSIGLYLLLPGFRTSLITFFLKFPLKALISMSDITESVLWKTLLAFVVAGFGCSDGGSTLLLLVFRFLFTLFSFFESVWFVDVEDVDDVNVDDPVDDDGVSSSDPALLVSMATLSLSSTPSMMMTSSSEEPPESSDEVATSIGLVSVGGVLSGVDEPTSNNE